METYTRNIITALAQLNEIDMLLWTTAREEADVRKQFSDVKGISVSSPFTHPHTYTKLFRRVVEHHKQRVVWNSVAKEADIVFCTDPMKYPKSIPNAIVMVHDVIPLYANPLWTKAKHSRRYGYVMNAIEHNALAILCPSEFVKDDILRYTSIEESRIHVVPEAGYPVEPDFSSSGGVLQSLGLSDGMRYILYVGRIDPRKNFETLFAAYSQIVKSQPDVRLVIAGGAGRGTTKRMYRRIAEAGLTDAVIHLPGRSDTEIQTLYHHAQAFVFLSYCEGFGLPVIEAMQCGAPVVCSDTTSLPEVAGNAAFIIKPDDVPSATRILTDLLYDSSLRERHR
ncbi:MAG: glycosyltransferase family 4 protein, partial [Candidatus Kapabacteria bacterium]|nr:glycosyltransferase family 4 protein [Candidatus Kapabacteria bacterium]